jgi:glycosyltransferase involved in cell wall biosynthesis
LVHAWGTEDGAILVASRLGYPYVGTVQGLIEWYAQETRLTRYDHFGAPLERTALSRSRVLTAESTFSANFIRQRYPAAEVHRVDVVPDELFHTVRRQPETAPVRLLFVGQLGHRKGGDLLVRALDRAGLDFRLLVVGDIEGPLMDEVRRQVSPDLWRRIELRNGLTSEEVASEMSRTTLLVCPTRADTGPMAVKEAAVAGVPVVGSAVGGIPDYIQPGKNGLIFPSGDLPALVEALRSAAAHPLFREGKVDGATLDKVRAELSPLAMAQKFLAVYERAVGKRRD